MSSIEKRKKWKWKGKLCVDLLKGGKTHSPLFSTPTPPPSCNSTIARLERVDTDELFVSPLTLQSFTCEYSWNEISFEMRFFFLL